MAINNMLSRISASSNRAVHFARPSSLLLTAMLMLAGTAQAEGAGMLKDPTVPPAAWLAAQPSAQGAEAIVHGSDPTRVKVVVFGKTRRFALIGDQFVKVGDTHNGAQVLAIKPDALRVDDEAQWLKAAPGVEKKASSRIAPKQPRRIIVGGPTTANENQTTGNRSSQ